MGKDREKTKLPIFGVGPVYVISCLILTICGLSLDYYGLLESGEVPKVKILLSIIGNNLYYMWYYFMDKSCFISKNKG